MRTLHIKFNYEIPYNVEILFDKYIILISNSIIEFIHNKINLILRYQFVIYNININFFFKNTYSLI